MVCMCTCLWMYMCVSHWFCFSEEPWIIQSALSVLDSAAFWLERIEALGKLASAPAPSIKQCLQPSNWTFCFICSKKENKFCLFPLCFYQSVFFLFLFFLTRVGSFSCGLTGSENNIDIFVKHKSKEKLELICNLALSSQGIFVCVQSARLSDVRRALKTMDSESQSC